MFIQVKLLDATTAKEPSNKVIGRHPPKCLFITKKNTGALQNEKQVFMNESPNVTRMQMLKLLKSVDDQTKKKG